MEQGGLAGESVMAPEKERNDGPDASVLQFRSPLVTRVLIVDDHRTFADLLALSLDAESDFTCVGRASTVAEALLLADTLVPDIIIMDNGLPDGDGVDATRLILQDHPGIRVLIVTGHVDQNLFARAAQAGASALLAKYSALDEVLCMLRRAREGTFIVNSSLLAALTSSDPVGARVAGDVPVLTARERDVLALLAEGHDVGRIARALSITVTTCRSQVRNLRKKFGAHTQLEVVVKANRAGLVTRAMPQVSTPRGARHASSSGRPGGSR